jgi:MarR family transcriptional repressor of emrRAB
MQSISAREANVVAAWLLAAGEAVGHATAEAAGGSGELASALVTVVLFPGERVDALRQVLGLSPSGVVRGVDRLVAAGLVERRGGSGDAREVLIHPTRRGVRVAERILAARARVVDELLRGLTGRERAELVRLFEKLLTALASDREAARRICRLCDHPACERSRCPVSDGAPGEGHRSHPAGGFGRSR